MRSAIFAAVFCICGGAGWAQDDVELTLEQARAVAVRAVENEQPELALALARKLLQANPDDRDALIVVAAAAPRVGEAEAGRQAGLRAWQLSETDTQKYEAARLVAQAAANEKRFTLAGYWLRRALIVAPDDAAEEQTKRDATVVRRLNPWSTTFGFSILPSNNVNGGADAINDLGSSIPSEDSLALSGIKAALNFQTRYRLNQSENHQTTVALRYDLSRVRLDDEGDPNIVTTTEDGDTIITSVLRNEDYGSDYSELSLTHDRKLGGVLVGGTYTIGRYVYGEERRYDFDRISLNARAPVNDRTAFQLTVQHEKQDYVLTSIEYVDKSTLRGTITHRTNAGNRISTSLAYTWTDSRSNNYQYDDWTIYASHTWAEPVGPVSLSVGAGLRFTDYGLYEILFLEGPRNDKTLFYNATIGVPDIEFAGFTPAIVISGSNADSNIDRFTRDTFSAGLTIRSSF